MSIGSSIVPTPFAFGAQYRAPVTGVGFVVVPAGTVVTTPPFVVVMVVVVVEVVVVAGLVSVTCGVFPLSLNPLPMWAMEEV